MVLIDFEVIGSDKMMVQDDVTADGIENTRFSRNQKMLYQNLWFFRLVR